MRARGRAAHYDHRDTGGAPDPALDVRHLDPSAAAGCALAIKHADQAVLDAYVEPAASQPKPKAGC